METLDDAMADVMMGEGDNLQVLISETFVECSEDSATEYLEKLSQVSVFRLVSRLYLINV